MNGGDPLETWAKTKGEHPRRRENMVGVGREQAAEGAFATPSRCSGTQLIIACRRANRSPSRRRPISTAGYRLHSISGHPAPFEMAKATRAYYYLTDVDGSWSAERQDEHLR